MRGAVLYGARDVRFEERADPAIIEPTDAIVRLPATCNYELSSRQLIVTPSSPDEHWKVAWEKR